MLKIKLLLLTATLLSCYGLDPMTAEERIYFGDFPPPVYSVDNTGNGVNYPYHNNYNNFPPTYNNDYHSLPRYSVTPRVTNFQAQPFNGPTDFSDFSRYVPAMPVRSYNNFGLATAHVGNGGSGPLGGQIGLVNGDHFAIPYIQHRPIFGGLHASTNFGINGIPVHLANGLYSNYNPYSSTMGVIHPYK